MKKLKYSEVRADAILYAEHRMGESWDRRDGILIANFYSYMLQFIDDNYELVKKKVLNP
jgi:hypothetical protein